MNSTSSALQQTLQRRRRQCRRRTQPRQYPTNDEQCGRRNTRMTGSDTHELSSARECRIK